MGQVASPASTTGRVAAWTLSITSARTRSERRGPVGYRLVGPAGRAAIGPEEFAELGHQGREGRGAAGVGLGQARGEVGVEAGDLGSEAGAGGVGQDGVAASAQGGSLREHLGKWGGVGRWLAHGYVPGRECDGFRVAAGARAGKGPPYGLRSAQ
jgi:hypothetical protein